jgi:hypothetical protein
LAVYQVPGAGAPALQGQPLVLNDHLVAASQQQTQRTLLDWLRVEYTIEKPGNKLQSASALDSETLVSEVERLRGRELPLTTAGVQRLRDEYTRTIASCSACTVSP